MKMTGVETLGLRMRHTFILMKLSTLRTAEYGVSMFHMKLMNFFFIMVYCTAWCALSANGIIGSLWFQEQGVTVTINQKRCQSVINTFYGLLQRRQNLQFESQWFQQDGATPYTATATTKYLDKLFPGNAISKSRHVLRTSVHLTSFYRNTANTTCTTIINRK